jgi:bifunctional DNase/RNase
MEKIRLKILGLSTSQSQTGAYALIMGEVEGKRRLPIIIGGFEAQSIAIELEKMKPSRPLTHDLFKSFAKQFDIQIKEVIINKFFEGVFYAKLVCEHNSEEVEIDSRTSDAVAIALRFHCPIFTYENIMSAAGIIMDEDKSKKVKQETDEIPNEDQYASMSLDELQEQLDQAVTNEEYEKASRIRDELIRRKQQK